MPKYAEPDIIACPHCEQRFLRHVIMSFDPTWRVAYSDGGVMGVLADAVITESRCTHCQTVIENVSDLTVIDIKSTRSFWRKWFTDTTNYLYLTQASFDVYIELFECTDVIDEKCNWAVHAYRQFNRSYLVYGNERLPSENNKQYYSKVSDFILAHPLALPFDEYTLLCADIYRLRSEFLTSKNMYCTVLDENYRHIVEQGKHWCDTSNSSLMAIK
jgi:hypothetical protein